MVRREEKTLKAMLIMALALILASTVLASDYSIRIEQKERECYMGLIPMELVIENTSNIPMFVRISQADGRDYKILFPFSMPGEEPSLDLLNPEIPAGETKRIGFAIQPLIPEGTILVEIPVYIDYGGVSKEEVLTAEVTFYGCVVRDENWNEQSEEGESNAENYLGRNTEVFVTKRAEIMNDRIKVIVTVYTNNPVQVELRDEIPRNMRYEGDDYYIGTVFGEQSIEYYLFPESEGEILLPPATVVYYDGVTQRRIYSNQLRVEFSKKENEISRERGSGQRGSPATPPGMEITENYNTKSYDEERDGRETARKLESSREANKERTEYKQQEWMSYQKRTRRTMRSNSNILYFLGEDPINYLLFGVLLGLLLGIPVGILSSRS